MSSVLIGLPIMTEAQSRTDNQANDIYRGTSGYIDYSSHTPVLSWQSDRHHATIANPDNHSTHTNLPNLPDLGNGSNRFVEEREHKALGEWSLRQLYAQAPIIEDAWIQEELNELTWQLNSQVRTQAPLALVVINNANINAFAIPGGVIGINTGTVLAANSMDEVASVLAHEVAHLSQRHYEHRSEADTKAILVQVATLLAGAVAASVDGDAATAIMLGGQTAAQNSRMAFSRSNEREADRIGMQIMAQSGFDPRAMPQFFATLNARSELNSNSNAFLPSFIMTHPLSAERLSEAQTRANSYANAGIYQYTNQGVGITSQKLRFDLLKWRIAVLSDQVQETDLLTAVNQSDAARLALATFYADKGRYVSANNALAIFNTMPTVQQQSYEPLLSITKAHIAGKQGQWRTAVQLLQRQQALYPERRDLRLYLVDAQLHLPITNATQTQLQIQRLLSPLIEQTPHDIGVLKRLQYSYEKLATHQLHRNNSQFATLYTVKGLRHRGLSELWQGQYDKAGQSLQQARRLATTLEGSTINPKTLLFSIDDDIATLKQVQAFHP